MYRAYCTKMGAAPWRQGILQNSPQLNVFIVAFPCWETRVLRVLSESIDFRSQLPRHLARRLTFVPTIIWGWLKLWPILCTSKRKIERKRKGCVHFILIDTCNFSSQLVAMCAAFSCNYRVATAITRGGSAKVHQEG